MKKNPDIVVKKVPPAIFLVDITKCYNSKQESLIEIDEIGLSLWNLIDEGCSQEELLARFLELLTDEKTDEFISMVQKDVNNFVEILVSNHCLIREEQI